MVDAVGGGGRTPWKGPPTGSDPGRHERSGRIPLQPGRCIAKGVARLACIAKGVARLAALTWSVVGSVLGSGVAGLGSGLVSGWKSALTGGALRLET